MTDEIRSEIKTYFENKKYDEVVKMINTKIILDESNYKKIFHEILNILNSIRINRDINEHEELVEMEEKFALNFTGDIYSFFLKSGIGKEKIQEIHGECANFYNALVSVTSIGSVVYNDENNTKINNVI